MAIDGKIGSLSYDDKKVRGSGHPPVLRTGKVKADNGAYPMGMIASKDTNGDIVPYDVAETFYGVLDEACDTATTGAANAIVHGSVLQEELKANIAGDAPDATLLEVLFSNGIYPE